MTGLTINTRGNSGLSDTEANRDDASGQTWTKAMADVSRDASSLGDRGDIAQREEHPRMDVPRGDVADAVRPLGVWVHDKYVPSKEEAEWAAEQAEKDGDAARRMRNPQL